MNFVLGVRERWLNFLLFFLFMWFSIYALYSAHVQRGIDETDISFAVQNAVFCAVILLRRPAESVDGSFLRQIVALAAFFSGLLFFDSPLAGAEPPRIMGRILVISANALAVVCLFTLGRSFGILIACRELCTRGVYSLLRHPMYSSDMLLRLGYVAAHPTLKTGTLFVFCCGLYYWRALLEERFLARHTPAYAEYALRVTHRFIPGVL